MKCMIRIIIDGVCGHMGKRITRLVVQQEDMQLIGAITSPNHPQLGQDAGEVAGVGLLGVPIGNELSTIIDGCDVVIEFTKPIPTIEHLGNAVDAGKAMVIGTTGFNAAELAQVRQLVTQIPCVMAPNMSVGVNALLQALPFIAKALGEDFDIEVIEGHHNQKADAPSGTALRIAEVVSETVGRELPEVALYGRRGVIGERSKTEIGVHAVRGGDLAGEHTVLFAGVGEHLEITHRSLSRQAFAEGAIRAARWVVSAPKGLHDIREVLTIPLHRISSGICSGDFSRLWHAPND